MCSSERMYPDIVDYEEVVKVTGSFKAPMGKQNCPYKTH